MKAFSRIKRIDGFFRTREAIIDLTFNSEKGRGPFKEFPFDLVKAHYSTKQPLNGEVLGLIVEESPIDEDFFLQDSGWHIIIVTADELLQLTQRALELLDKTDETTQSMLRRGWRGKRPVPPKLHHFM